MITRLILVLVHLTYADVVRKIQCHPTIDLAKQTQIFQMYVGTLDFIAEILMPWPKANDSYNEYLKV